MAYIPNEWKDQQVQRPKTYQMNTNDDGSVTLVDSFGLVTELGTPVNKDYMNHIEQGIAGAAIRYYKTTETFKNNEVVLNINTEGGVELWKSLADNNYGNTLADETKWEQVNFCASLPIGTLYPSFAAAGYVPEFAVPADGAEYSGAQFPGLWSDYLTASTPKLLTKNYTRYQADITAYGKCAAFGVEHTISATHTGTGITDVEVTAATWETKVSTVGSYVFSYDGSGWSLDSSEVELSTYGVVLTGTPASGDTVTVTYAYGGSFKVPYIPDGTHIQQAMSDGEAGKAYNAGLPNIIGWADTTAQWGAAQGAFSVENAGSNYFTGAAQSGDDALRFDASESNPIYGASDTVQPEAVGLRWFVVVANGVENEAAMDWSEWATGLAGKANVDLSNCTKPYVVETYRNGTSWYRVWSNGFIEQGGVQEGHSGDITYFLKKFTNDYPNVIVSAHWSAGGYNIGVNMRYADRFTIYSSYAVPGLVAWTWYANGW